MSRLIPGRDSFLDESAQVEALAGTLVAALARPAASRPEMRWSVVAPVPAAEPERAPPCLVDLQAGPATPEVDADLPPVDAPDGPVGALWRDYVGTRSRASRDGLVLQYVPLVRSLAHRMVNGMPAHVDLADLVQSGTFGLLDALERFDPARNSRFESFAAQRIRGAMLDELRAQDWVPRTVRGRVREVERAQERLEARLGRAVTDRELAAELGMAVADLRTTVRQVHLLSVEALDERVDGHGGVSETLADEALPDPMAVVQHRETERQLFDAVGQLGERDRSVIHMYYVENRTLAEIGRRLGVTESRVCQLHSRLVVRLRGRLEELAAG